MTILVTGGAGYIGSQMAYQLVDSGERVVVLDNLSTGFDWAIPSGVPTVTGDVGDAHLVDALIAESNVAQNGVRVRAALHCRDDEACLPLHRIDLRRFEMLFVAADEQHAGDRQKDDQEVEERQPDRDPRQKLRWTRHHLASG